MDVEKSAELYFKDLPMEYDLAGANGKIREVAARPPDEVQRRAGGAGIPPQASGDDLRDDPRGRVMKKVIRTGVDDLQKRVLPAFNEFAAKARAKKLGGDVGRGGAGRSRRAREGRAQRVRPRAPQAGLPGVLTTSAVCRPRWR